MTREEKSQLLKVCEVIHLAKFSFFSCTAIRSILGPLIAEEYGQFFGSDSNDFWFIEDKEPTNQHRILMVLLFREVGGLEGLNAS